MSAQTLTADFRTKADAIVARYETKRASILEVLRLVMEEYGHITPEAEKEVASYLEIAPIDVREIMTFYSLFYRKPRAKTRFHVCRTLACSLAGGDRMVAYLCEKLGIKPGETTPDGTFSLETVECLGACEIAPMMQLNDKEYLGPLTEEKLDTLLEAGRRAGEKR